MDKYYTIIEPIGCLCEGRERLLSEICGHLPSNKKCNFDRFKCNLCHRKYKYKSWVEYHIYYFHKIDRL
jgi:hypothetical protein